MLSLFMHIFTSTKMISLACLTKREVFFLKTSPFWFVILGVETQGLVWTWFRGLVLFCVAYYFRAVWDL